MTCEICGNPKRKLRFNTVRLSICQWCVTELSYSIDSPKDVLLAAHQRFLEKRLFDIAIGSRATNGDNSLPPSYPFEELEKVSFTANARVRSQESFLVANYRDLVSDSARIEHVEKQVTLIKAEIQNQYCKSLERHRQKTERQKLQDEAIEKELNDGVEVDMRRFMSFRIGSSKTKFKATRLLRANDVGILNTEKKYLRRLSESETKATNKAIRSQDGHQCVICQKSGENIELHVHHIIPLSQFGTNFERNLATLCFSCHCRQHPGIDMTKSDLRNNE